MERIIREALPDDMPDIMAVIDAAKGIMRQSGNMHQWGEGYPSETAITADMENHGGFVVEDDDKVVGYFAFLRSPEPTYAKIYKGKWLDDAEPYHVVHRIASYPDVHGIFSSIMEYCFSQDPNIRIDTHRDNRIMQHNIAKHGFSYCGIIYLASGDERLAYQRILTRRNHCDMENNDIGELLQIERIKRMEQRFNKALAAIKDKSADSLKAVEEDVAELSKYYGSELWKQDLAADEAGNLPSDLKRGVLSEDGIWNLLSDYRDFLIFL